MNEFDRRYFPYKRKFPDRAKKFFRDPGELRLERIKIPGYQLQISKIAMPSPVKNAVGKRLAFVSDWHWHGSEKNYRILDEFCGILKQYPVDILLCGGDISDDAVFIKTLPPLLEKLGKAAPAVISVNGNWEHGKRWLKPDFFTSMFTEYGITLLENQEFRNEWIYISGLPDISSIDFHALPPPEVGEDSLNILLVHSPDAVVASDKHGFLKNFHLALCGHTHGGQIRLPLIGALYCPSFYRCKFDRGIFSRQNLDLKMIVSGGIGEHFRTDRFLCPPEVIILELV